jgi:hypothetical protein
VKEASERSICWIKPANLKITAVKEGEQVLSFQEYVWEMRIARVREEIAWNLVLTGQTLEEFMEDYLYRRPRVQSELFGGFFNRIGAAWQAFWHGPEEPPSYTAVDVQDMLTKQADQFQATIYELGQQLRAAIGFDAQKQLEALLSDVLIQTRGHMYDLMDGIRQTELAKKGYEKGGIMEKLMTALQKLQRIMEDPRIGYEEKAKQIPQIEEEISDIKKEAEAIGGKADATEPQKKEAAAALDTLNNNESLTKLLNSLADIKERIKNKAAQGAGGDSGGQKPGDSQFWQTINQMAAKVRGFDIKATDIQSAWAEAHATGKSEDEIATSLFKWFVAHQNDPAVTGILQKTSIARLQGISDPENFALSLYSILKLRASKNWKT